jgi:hypothetical protein
MNSEKTYVIVFNPMTKQYEKIERKINNDK